MKKRACSWFVERRAMPPSHRRRMKTSCQPVPQPGDPTAHPSTGVALPRRRDEQGVGCRRRRKWLQLYLPKPEAYLFFFSSSLISLNSNAITKITSRVESSNNRPGV